MPPLRWPAPVVVCGVPRIAACTTATANSVVSTTGHWTVRSTGVSSKWLVCPCPCPVLALESFQGRSGTCRPGRCRRWGVCLAARRSRLGRREEDGLLERSNVLHDVGGHLLEGRPESVALAARRWARGFMLLSGVNVRRERISPRPRGVYSLLLVCSW